MYLQRQRPDFNFSVVKSRFVLFLSQVIGVYVTLKSDSQLVAKVTSNKCYHSSYNCNPNTHLSKLCNFNSSYYKHRIRI